jgi:hypothetical protein
MTDKLVVYTYNILFGDAILVEVPDGSSHKFILIDVGNAFRGVGAADKPLLDAAKDIKERTGGKIDLYIMTHEHWDHVQGLLCAKENGCEFQIDTIWMTVSSQPEYYNSHPKAKEKHLNLEQAMKAFQGLTNVSGCPTELAAIIELNTMSTDECVNFIRGLTPNVYYVYRGLDVTGRHPFTDTAIRILAPEEDSSIYYGPLPHFDFQEDSPEISSATGRPLPLPGIDGGAFYGLVDRMDSACAEGVFAIDQAANNTSIVFELTWRGRRLLFTGDAEKKSWQFMDKNTTLQPVDFIKIGHHGSRNALPQKAILDKILPSQRRGQAVAVVSTFPGAYSGVPDPVAIDTFKSHVGNFYSTMDVPSGEPVTIDFKERS